MVSKHHINHQTPSVDDWGGYGAKRTESIAQGQRERGKREKVMAYRPGKRYGGARPEVGWVMVVCVSTYQHWDMYMICYDMI